MPADRPDRLSRRDTPAWVLAGWWGALAGLFDAIAGFLHPVSVVVIPFAIFVYVLCALVLYATTDMCRRLIGRFLPGRSPGRGLTLGVVVGSSLTFFAAYAVTTSASPLFGSRTGLALGLALAVLAGLLGFSASWLLWSRRARRHRHGDLRSAVVLLILVLVYPLMFITGQLTGRQTDSTSSHAPRGFVLVSLDAARGDRISGLGYGRPTTPAVDRLIEGGTAYSRAYVEQPASGPGHACMLTGLPPLVHGVVANTNVLGDSVVTIAERLRDEGFRTAAFLNNFYLESRFGFAQGFEWFINQYRASRLAGFNPRLLLRGLSLFHLWHRLNHRPGQRTSDTIDLALSWLQGRQHEDFFLFLHIMDPHSPYAPPPDLRQQFYRPDGPPVHDTLALRRRMDALTPVEVAALRDLYDADVALADRKVGRLVAALKRLGRLDSTLLVITADHGEVLYEKDHVFDHGLIHQGNLHVPLVFHYPGKVPPGLVSKQPVPATALAPTALFLLDLPYVEQTEPAFHAPLLADQQPVVRPAPAYVFTLTGMRDIDLAATVGERYKVVVHAEEIVALYDLDRDPTEQNNLWPDLGADGTGQELRERAWRMRDALLDWLARGAQQAVGLRSQSPAAVDRETARRLEALGYVD